MSIPKSNKPLLSNDKGVVSKFNIQKNLEEKIKKVAETPQNNEEKLPNHHFSQQDLDTFWNAYLEKTKPDIVLFSAISGFLLTKIDENTIEVKYPSESSLDKFSKVQTEFLNQFKHKTQHYAVSLDFKIDITLKREIITPKNTFEKYLEINPLLKDLDSLVKFDFS